MWKSSNRSVAGAESCKRALRVEVANYVVAQGKSVTGRHSPATEGRNVKIKNGDLAVCVSMLIFAIAKGGGIMSKPASLFLPSAFGVTKPGLGFSTRRSVISTRRVVAPSSGVDNAKPDAANPARRTLYEVGTKNT